MSWDSWWAHGVGAIRAALLLGGITACLTLASMCAGCSPSTVQLHTTIAAALEQAAESSNTIVRQVRTDAGYQAALHAHDTAGTEASADTAASAAEARLQPAVDAQRLGAAAAHAYVLGVLRWLSGNASLASLLPLLGDAVHAWQAFTDLGRTLHIDSIASLALSGAALSAIDAFLPTAPGGAQ